MKRLNYYQVHKNKKPRKLKYNKLYTKSMLKRFEEVMEYFIQESQKLKIY